MNIAIVGSRTFNDYESMKKFILNRIKIEDVEFIVSGGADGADTLAEKFAEEFKIKMMVFRPEWEVYGKSAGMIRNKDIINHSDTVFAFWDGKSKGTANSISLANKDKKPCYMLRFKNE